MIAGVLASANGTDDITVHPAMATGNTRRDRSINDRRALKY
jgi:hypothetical protein